MKSAALSVALVLALASTAHATGPFKDQLVQAPQLQKPGRGSVAGSLSKVAFGPADLARGAFSLPMPIDLPEARGPALASIVPSYSPEAAQTEWGMGWQAELAIRRFRLSGDLDYATDGFSSPWGRLVQGSDGAFYPSGISKIVRLQATSAGWTADLPDGTRYTFAAAITTSRGTYAWMLTDVATLAGDHAVLEWDRNASGRLFLSRISYGGRGTPAQYKVELAYETLAAPLVDYRSGDALTLDRRVIEVRASARSGGSGDFALMWRHTLTYQAAPVGPAFYLASVTKTWRSGQSDPAQRYTYDFGSDRLQSAQLVAVPALDPYLTSAGDTAIQPDKVAQVDVDQDGLTDLEHPYSQMLVHHTGATWTYESLPARTGTENAWCRPAPSLANPPRTLARMTADATDPHVVVNHFDSTSGQTALLVCTRAGQVIHQEQLAGGWALGPNTRLVDLNRDHRPDFIRVFQGGYEVIENASAGTSWSFVRHAARSLTPVFQPDSTWVHDVNGDGLPDLIARYSGGVVVWYGQGNFQFAPVGQVFTFRSLAGVQLADLSNWQFSFVDVNHDGLTDVLLSQGRVLSLFVNQGSGFVEVAIPGVRTMPWDFGYPVIADLSGGGNTEVVFANSHHGYAIDLAGASTGLLIGADDGKGTALSFGYDWAPPAAGAITRPAVLTALTINSSGYDTLSYAYDYASPTLHSIGKFLVGFGRARRSGPLGTDEVDFHHDDDVANVVTDTIGTDTRTPLLRFSHGDFEDHLFRGLRFWRRLGETSGWRTPDGSTEVSQRVDYLAYDREICATSIRTTTAQGVLTRDVTLVNVPRLDSTLHCLAGGERLSGRHPDTSLDFSYASAIARNDIGQLTSITMLGPSGPWVLQEVGYDAQYRVAQVSQPGLGATRVTYDPSTGLPSRVVTADGVATAVDEYDPLTDAVRALGIDRGGSGGRWTGFFRYDGAERLASSWDDAGAANVSAPLQALTYQYATASAPGSVRERNLVDLATNSYRDSVGFVTAAGEGVADATLVPQGWAVSGLVTRSRVQGETHHWYRPPVAAADPQTLRHADLVSGAIELALSRSANFGQTVHEQQTVQSGVQHTIEHTFALSGGVRVETTTENGIYITQTATDVRGEVVSFTDQNGTQTRYEYDVLGRPIGVTLADGHRQVVHLDGYGRPGLVERDGLAQISYQYDATSGELSQKQFATAAGRLDRTVSWIRDAIGRVLTETHTSATSGESHAFHYDRDGIIPGEPTIPGQWGRVSRVTGDGFEKRFVYDPRGNLVRTSLGFPGWRTLAEQREYFENGANRSRTLTVLDGAGSVLQTVQLENVYDAYGRLQTIRLGDADLARLTYDAEGKLVRADIAGGRTLTLHYDPVTRRPSGFWEDSVRWNAGVDWQFDARGQVASEDIVFGDDHHQRQYGYDARGFLTSASDRDGNAAYAYAPNGLLTRVDDAMGSRPLDRTATTIDAGGVAYELDDLGRVARKDDLTLEYGPTGAIEVAHRGARTWQYVYDESGARILKLENGAAVAAFVEDSVLTSDHLYIPVHLAGRVVGIVDNGEFKLLATDPRSTVLGDDGVANLPSPYGARAQHPTEAAVLDFVEKGWDADLGVVRMGVRDYDPFLGQFWSPDPLFLEAIDKCAASPIACNLYGYARNNPLSFTDASGMQQQQLPPLDHSLYVPEGPLESSYHEAINAAFDPGIKWWMRGVSFALAAGIAIPASVESVANAAANVPYKASRMGQHVARAYLTDNTFQRWDEISLAISFGCDGFNSAAAVAAPLADGLAPRVPMEWAPSVELTSAEVGSLGEKAAANYLKERGYTNIRAIQNASGHGIDLVGELNGKTHFFEVKATQGTVAGRLSEAQSNIVDFVRSRLQKAARPGTPQWKNISPEMRKDAMQLLGKVNGGMKVEGEVLEVTGVGTPSLSVNARPW